MIYCWHKPRDTIDLLLIYSKIDQDDLTPRQVKMLSRLVREGSSEEQ